VNGAIVLRNVQPLSPWAGGQVCEDCANCTRYRWPPVRVAKSDVYKAVSAAYPAGGALGQVTNVRVFSCTSYGRILWLDVAGKPGVEPLRLRADDLRLALIRLKNPAGASPAAGLYSMNCQIRSVGDYIEFYDGKGFGHGVGLCQWGAQGKAARGWPAMAILNFYYPGAKIAKEY
jgi:peptidoglycan hydrolase-like amidase